MKELTDKEKKQVDQALGSGKPLGMTGIVFDGTLRKFTKGETKDSVVRDIIDKIPAAPAVTADMPSQEVASSVATGEDTTTGGTATDAGTTPPKESDGTTKDTD